MPQLDLITLLDQLVASYAVFIFVHFLMSLVVVPTIFKPLYLRYLVFYAMTDFVDSSANEISFLKFLANEVDSDLNLNFFVY